MLNSVIFTFGVSIVFQQKYIIIRETLNFMFDFVRL